eukprot:Pgem_evm1s10072
MVETYIFYSCSKSVFELLEQNPQCKNQCKNTAKTSAGKKKIIIKNLHFRSKKTQGKIKVQECLFVHLTA